MPEINDIPRLSSTGFVSSGTASASARAARSRPEIETVRSVSTVRAAPGWKSALPAKTLQSKQPLKPRSGSRRRAESEEDRKTAGLLIKLGVCAAICTLALGLKLINTPATDLITKEVKNAITSDMDFDDTLGKLKFVQNDTTTVFGDSTAVTLPVKGGLRAQFGEGGSGGVLFSCTQGEAVMACADGVVEAVGTDVSGAYVRIRHAAGLETLTYGLEAANVEDGQPLKSGDVIGKAKTDTLRFEALVNGEAQDPIKLYNALTNG